jgi:hypothetical protein
MAAESLMFSWSVSADWKTRLDETFSDSNGRFGLSQVSQGVYYLKLSKSGFCTLRFKVSVKRKSKEGLKLTLPLGI